MESGEKRRDPTELCLRSTLVGIVSSALLVAVKGIAGVVGHSHALIADAIESTTDIFSSLIVFGGIKIAAIPPDANHPYGHGKAEPLAAILVSVGLYTAAAAITIQSIREVLNPQYAPAPFTLLVLVLVVITKEGLFRYVDKVGQSTGSTAVKTDAWHHRSDAITSAAAFVGILVAVVGGEGYEVADDWAALFASAIIAFNATWLIRPALAEIMDTAPDSDVEREVRDVAAAVPEVLGLDVCFVRKMGLDFYVDLHVVVDGDLTVSEGHRIAHKVKDAVKGSNPKISDILVHIEPVGLPALRSIDRGSRSEST
jgi:cation diffusion facilitator family transporter